MSSESMSFEKWYRDVGYLGDDQNTRAKIAYEAGAQSRQDERDELKQRIDYALTFSATWHKSSGSALALEIIKILKGKENEN